ncbi:hypothetical protein GCM10017711_04650 [Paeniglutamicibacter sulfureus]
MHSSPGQSGSFGDADAALGGVPGALAAAVGAGCPVGAERLEAVAAVLPEGPGEGGAGAQAPNAETSSNAAHRAARLRTTVPRTNR